jgi:hypothetical protein
MGGPMKELDGRVERIKRAVETRMRDILEEHQPTNTAG